MAWSIQGNFSPEVWDIVRNNLSAMDRDELATIILDVLESKEEARRERAEAKIAACPCGLKRRKLRRKEEERQGKIDKNIDAIERFASHDALVEAAVEMIEKTDTCDNGGWYFWIDPGGWHKVSTKERETSE